MSIESLLEEMYDNYGTTDKSGIDYFSGYIDDLKSFDFQDLAICQMAKYDLQYNLDFFLSSSALWSDLKPVQWLDILEKAERHELNELDDSGSYADIVFMCKYLDVDAISAICSSSSVLQEVKESVLNYVNLQLHRFQLDDIDAEDLDGIYFISAERLIEVKEVLLNSGLFLEFDSSEAALLKKLENLRASLTS